MCITLYDDRCMEHINKIIIHCSDSDQEAHDDIGIIRAWHITKGWKDVGYHFFIKSDGVVQFGRSLNEEGAHCKGQNDDSIGICLAGRHYFSEFQYQSLVRLVSALLILFELEFSDVYEHNYFDPTKTCPNMDWYKFQDLLRGIKWII